MSAPTASARAPADAAAAPSCHPGGGTGGGCGCAHACAGNGVDADGDADTMSPAGKGGTRLAPLTAHALEVVSGRSQTEPGRTGLLQAPGLAGAVAPTPTRVPGAGAVAPTSGGPETAPGAFAPSSLGFAGAFAPTNPPHLPGLLPDPLAGSMFADAVGSAHGRALARARGVCEQLNGSGGEGADEAQAEEEDGGSDLQDTSGCLHDVSCSCSSSCTTTAQAHTCT